MLGTCLIVGLIVIFSIGTRTYFKLQNILILFAVASTVITVVVFIGKVPADTIHAFNEHLRGRVRARRPVRLCDCVRQGDRLHRPRADVALLDAHGHDWIYLDLSFMSSSAYIGSEVKNARKLQLWSMPATLFIVGLRRSDQRVGHPSGRSATTSSRSSAGPTRRASVSSRRQCSLELAAYVANNIWIAFIILFGFIFWSYAWLPGRVR